MSMKQRLREGWEKVRFFFYKLNHPEAHKKVVENTKQVIGETKNGVILYLQTGKMKMEKINLETRLRDKYVHLGKICEKMIKKGIFPSEGECSSLIEEIEKLKKNLREVKSKINRNS